MTGKHTVVDTPSTTDGGLVVLCKATWPTAGDTAPTPVAGFVVSQFNPLVVQVADRCLAAHYGSPPADPRTGVVLASVAGDTATADATSAAVRAGRKPAPLLFFQSNPNAVVGYVTARWDLRGPVVCTSPTGDPLTDAMTVAALLIDDGDATQVLVITAELDGDTGRADALLVSRDAKETR
jgi:hypothetical protein